MGHSLLFLNPHSCPFMILRTIDTMRRISSGFLNIRCALLVAALFANCSLASAAEPPEVRIESPAEATRRHERVTERRRGIDIICHRGSSELAHENTLEAFRATFELGGDGNEFDIR